MGHVYPLASDARGDLEGAVHAARTRADAERLAGEAAVEALQTDWLTPEPGELDALLAQADRAVGDGFVQRYEDEAGNPVLAVTYWRVAENVSVKAAAPAVPRQAEPDHTDDLYFRAGRTRRRRPRQRFVDPRQLDLFTGPDQQGFEHRDPDNPAIIITDEEGDGTTFGD